MGAETEQRKHEGEDESPSLKGFLCPTLAKERGEAIKGTLMGFGILVVALWALLSIYWGSTYRINTYFYRTIIHIYDFDSVASGSAALVGPTVTRALLESMSSPTHFTYVVQNANGVSEAEIVDRIVNEKAWLAVVINANATTAWQSAISGTGGLLDGEYSAKGAISLIYTSARFYQVILSFIVPMTSQILSMANTQASHTAVARYLSSGVAPTTIANFSPTQLQAFGLPFSYQQVDVRPILDNQWAGAALQGAGLIYGTLSCFHIALFLYLARTAFDSIVTKSGKQLKLVHDVLYLRLLPAIVAYFWLALQFSLLNLAFQIPMNGNGHTKLNEGAGFMVFWSLMFFSFVALGLAMETMLSLLTIKFFPIFLTTWIVTNITSSFYPPTYMEFFYRYGYAMPFWNTTTASKYIFWGARNRLGMNFGILAGWSVLSMITLPCVVLLSRRKLEKERKEKVRKEVSEQAQGEKEVA